MFGRRAILLSTTNFGELDIDVSDALKFAAHAVKADAQINLTQHICKRLHSWLGTLGTSSFSGGAFLRSPWMPDDDDSPDIQLTVFPRVVEPHVTRKEHRNQVKVMQASAMLITVALLQPEARYKVRPSNTSIRTSCTGFQPAVHEWPERFGEKR